MITVSAIEKALHANFSNTVRARGEAYHRLGMVSEVSIRGSFINGTVRGSDAQPYNIVFEYDERYQELEGVCSCPYDDDCKHQVAVLVEAKNQLIASGNQPQLRNVSKNRGERRLKKTTQRQNTKPQQQRLAFEGGASSGTYRTLPLYRNSLTSALQNHRPRSYRGLGWNETFEGTFLSESRLQIKSVSTYGDYYGRYRSQAITLKWEDELLWIKCETCNKKMDTFCEHQMALLGKAKQSIESSGFLTGSLRYDDIVSHGVRNFGVAKEAFHKYFQVLLNENGFGIKAIKDNVLGVEWLNQTKDFFNKERKSRESAFQKQVRTFEEGRTKKYGFFWGKEDEDYAYDYDEDDEQEKALLLYFVQGNGFKTKEGIHGTGRRVEDFPHSFPEPYKSIGQDLFLALQGDTPQKQFEDIQNIILENIDQINEIYNYVSNEDMKYGNPKASELHLVKFDPNPLQCTFNIYKKDGLVHIERQITHEEQAFEFSKFIYINTVFGTTAKTAYLFPHHRFYDFMQLFPASDVLIIPFTNQKQYSELVNGLQQHFEVKVEEGLILEEETLENPRYQIMLRELGTFVLFEPRLKYGDYSFNAYESESAMIEDKIYRPNHSDREFLIDFLKNAHPDFNNPIQVQDYVFLDIREMINNYWFMHFNEACEAVGIEVVGVKDLSNFNYSTHRAVTFSHVKSGIDWFEVDMGVSFGDEVVKAADWIKALRNKESFVKLKDGSLGILPEEWLEHARKVLAVADVEKGQVKISKYRFNIIDDLFEDIDDKKILKELKAKKQRLAQIELNKQYALPSIVNADLRDYQKHGFEWLKFLDESGFGGILADDMGLGKTLQVITLLADNIDKGPSIVIVPRSLLFNWAAEIDKFCPDLKYVIHHGAGRKKNMEAILPINIIITTYGTATSDIEVFKDFEFNYIILDESQAIKNPDSKRYKAMRLLQAKNKIAMTGTPIENNTFDLYAQLSFTSPGLLGTKTSFRENFAIPIDNNADLEAANLLRKLVHPFLLRRTKEQVAKDLPEKTESIIYCEMGATQRKLYNNLKRKIKEDIETEVQERGIAKSKFKMLDGLLRLRQMCNSPLLLNKSFKGSNADSVKINILLQHLTEELDQHNALIFSQFVSLLSIVRKELEERGIKYAYLDGSTTKRQAEIDRFMKDDEIKVFLISLKAGNTGMNLTKADYVYILDPWWNPAVEAQAIDRTHRIGQDKQIFAYKLICKDSIEEKILKLQRKKADLAKDIIRTDENVLKSLQKDELMALFD